MSKLVYVCLNRSRQSSFVKQGLEVISKRLMPDNITALPPKVLDSEGIIVGIFNPTESITIKDCSVCLGNIIGAEEWHSPMRGRPDGTYALFRGNSDYIEVLTDAVASRTVWYFMSDDIFVAATSQRAIVSLLRSFEFNKEVIPWVLSTGTLGPVHAWDHRIKRLGGDSSIELDRKSWTLTTRTNSVNFSPLKTTEQEHEKLLRQALQETIKSIRLDYSKWALALSGGFDSRGILCLLEDPVGLRAITWGLRSSLYEELNDAYIAKDLARSFNLQHDYYETDIGSEPIADIFNRFLVCGEGRVDHISGYMDGFKIWKTLFESGIHGIIRADEGFGWGPVSSHSDVRFCVEIPLWSDFSNLKNLEEFCFTKQEMPDELAQREGESLEGWRDRLYHQFRIPVVLAALSDLKLPYVEIINPLLSRRIIYEVRRMPDDLRTDKNLYKSIVRSFSPNISFAKYPAIESPGNILKSKRVVEFLKEELSSAYVDSILSREFINYVLSRVTIIDGQQNARKRETLKDRVKSHLPKGIKNKIRHAVSKPKMDFNVLAFRAYMICRMSKMLSEDVESLRQVSIAAGDPRST
jgi:hypothetical protein